MRFLGVLGVIALYVTAAGCGKERQEQTAGWLEVKVDTAYKGQRLHFVAYAECISKYVPGGSFGATPGTRTISMRPKSIGRVMPDGSFVAFQMPELCGRYFDKRAPWQFTSTHFIPFMVWSDRQRRPTKMEAYLAERAFVALGSKLGVSTGIATPVNSVEEAAATTTRALPNVVLQDSHLISDEDEIGYKRGERGFRAAFGWRTAGEAGDASRQECIDRFRSGQLVPNREVIGHLTLEQCKDALASVTPFLWDGKQYRADQSRNGIIIFQRVDPRMNGVTSYFVGKELVRPASPAGSDPSRYHIRFVIAPASDPNQGV